MNVKKSKINEFNKNGVVKIKNLISKKTLKKCLSELTQKKNYKNAKRDGNVVFDKKGKKNKVKYLQHAQNYIPVFFELFNSEILEVAKKLLNQDVFYECMGIHNKAPKFGTETPFHQDNFYFCLSPSYALTAYVPLEKQSKKNGCLKYIKSSHKNGVMQHYQNNTKAFSSGLKKQKYNESEIIYPKLNLGDVVFHHCNIIHGAEGNYSNKNRNAVAIKIVGKKAKIDKRQLMIYKKFKKNNRNLNS